MPSTITGSRIVELANTRVGEQYRLGSIAPKDNALYHGPWDCAEFTSWLVFQVSGRLYGCNNNHGNPHIADAFTGFYHRDAQSIGIIIPVREAAGIPGAFLLRVASPSLMGHIVVSNGRGGTIEAAGRATGVINGTLAGRRWDMGILVPGIAYDNASRVRITPPATMVYRLTTPYMASAVVGNIQRALTQAGFNTMGIDNIYGRNTAKAVIAFQDVHGLVVDGEVGAKTASLLGVKLQAATALKKAGVVG